MNFSFDLLSQIASGKNMFSQSELKLAEFVMEKPGEVLSLSISELARLCGVSVATVSRFCKRVSLNGYQEFRLELMKALTNSADTPNTVQGEVGPEDDTQLSIKKLHATHQYTLAKSMEALDPSAVAQAVSYFKAAEDIHFFGSGAMLLTALNAKIQFMQVSTKFHCEMDPTIQALGASLVTENSVAVVFSYTGSTRNIVEIAKLAKRRGAKVIAITRYLHSPLTELSDLNLICGVSEGPYQTGSASVKIGMLFIIDVLYTEYCRRNPLLAQQNKEATSMAVIGKLHPLKNSK